MRTLICIRQLPYSKDTIRFGSLVTKPGDDSIILMTVVENDAAIPEAERGLVEARVLLDRPRAESKVRKGRVLDEILKESQENKKEIFQYLQPIYQPVC